MGETNDKLRKADAVRRRLAGAGRPRSINHRRLVRSLLLGTVAVAASIYWLAVEYQADMGELIGYLGGSALFVVLFAALAIAGAVGLRLLRRTGPRTGKSRE